MDDRLQMNALLDHDAELDPLVQSLRDSGFSDEQVSIMTPVPLSEAASARIGSVPLYGVTLMAGLAGIGVGIFFAGGTAAMYPLMTGGKPIVAAPIVGIISYETMMLLAIVVTFIATILCIKRAQRGVARHDTRIDDGYIVVSIILNPDRSQFPLARAVLQQAGALEISPPRGLSGHEGPEPTGQAAAAVLALLCLLPGLSACSRDMQEQPSYHPQEAPRLHSPAGSVPRDSRAVLSANRSPVRQARQDGERLFRINCAHCHGAEGAGDGPVARYLKEKPANLRAPQVQGLPELSIYDIVTDGKDVMPPFKGELSADERRAVAAYVKSLPSQ